MWVNSIHGAAAEDVTLKNALRLKFTPCLFCVCWNPFQHMFLYHYRLSHHPSKGEGGNEAIKRMKYCFESSTNVGIGCHNQSCVSLICLVYLDMMQCLVQNEKPSNRPTCKCLGGERGESREEKNGKALYPELLAINLASFLRRAPVM